MLAVIAAGLLVVVFATSAPADETCDTSWTGAVDGGWTNAGNWDGGIPADDQLACIGNGDTVTAADGASVARLKVSSGTLVVPDGATLAARVEVAGGALRGDGTIVGDVTNDGTVHPGATGPGTLTVTGNYGQGSDGTLSISATGSGDFGKVVADTATIGGALTFDASGFTLASCDPFAVVDASAAPTGAFATITGATFLQQAIDAGYLLTTVTSPGSPGPLVAAPGDGTASISWTAPGGCGTTTYDVAAVPQGSGTTVSADDVTGTSTTLSGLDNLKTYDVTVTPRNEAGDGTAAASVVDPNARPTGSITGPDSLRVNRSARFVATTSDDSGVKSVAWDVDGDGFDDGTGTTLDHTFTTSGAQTVRMQVTDDENATYIADDPVVVAANVAPSASFTVSPPRPTVGKDATLTSTSSDDTGIATTEWDFDNDGTYDQTGSQVTHQFPAAGSVTVGIRVTDDDSVSSTATQTFTVNAPPTGSVTGPSSVKINRTARFDSNAADDNGTPSVAWDVDGDGYDDGTGATLDYKFTSSGSKTVKAQITDGDNATTVVEKSVTVTPNTPPQPSFTVNPPKPTVGQEATLTSTSTDDTGISKVEWKFGSDGQWETGSSVQHAFTAAEGGTVSLRVTDDDNEPATTTQTLPVNVKPAIAISAPKIVHVNREVAFTASGTDTDGEIVSYAWDTNNDGKYDDATGATLKKTFTDQGNYVMRVEGTDDAGGVDYASATIVITPNNPPAAAFTVSPTPPVMGQQVTFTSTSSDPDGDADITSTDWDLDPSKPGFEASGPAATYTYPLFGAKTVTIKVTDRDGASNSSSQMFTVQSSTSSNGGTGTGTKPGGGVSIGLNTGTFPKRQPTVDTGRGDATTTSNSSDSSSGGGTVVQQQAVGSSLNGIFKVLSNGGIRSLLTNPLIAFTAPGAGVGIQSVEATNAALSKAASAAAAKPVVLAYGKRSFAKAGTANIRMRATRRGRVALKGVTKLRVTIRSTFKPTKGKTVVKTRRMTLKLKKPATG